MSYKNDDAVGKLYNTSKWKSTMKFIIEQNHGRCSRCGKIITGKFIVHHVKIATVNNFYDVSNLTLLCIECHNYVTFHEGVNRRGKQTYKDLDEYNGWLDEFIN